MNVSHGSPRRWAATDDAKLDELAALIGRLAVCIEI